MTTPLIAFERVSIGYERPLFDPLELTVGGGEFLGVVGPNGSGKTTLLKTMTGLLPPLSGAVRYPNGRPRIGYVPQQRGADDLFPLTATEIVRLGLIPHLPLLKRLGRRQSQTAHTWLDRLGIGALSDRLFRELSGGQRQRVLLARALAVDPHIVILDEPTSALDAVAAQRMLAELEQLNANGLTVVLVSHDLGRTAALARRLILLDGRNGLIRAGTRAEIMRDDVLSAIYGVRVHVHEHDCHYMVDFHLDEDCPTCG